MKFIKDREQWKINENLLQAKKVLKENNIPESDKLFLSLKKELKDNLGYIGWFTKMLVVNKIPSAEINNIINLIKNDKYIIDNLPNNLIEYSKWETLIDDIIQVKFNRNVKRVINELPASIRNTMSKKITDKHKSMFNDLFKHKDKSNFLRKVSRYHDYKSFISALNIFLSASGNSYAKIIQQIKVSGAKLIHDDESEDIIICEVNYEQIKKLGGDTSWCIVPSKNTFNSYVKDGNKQFIIFLTDITGNYSKIGTTIGFKVHNIHLKDDQYLPLKDLSNILSKRKFNIEDLYLTKEDFLKNNDINTISVKFLIDTVGFTKEFILDNKKSYQDTDLSYFTDSEKEKYNLNRNISIKTYHDFKTEFSDKINASSLISNIHRIRFKIDMHNLTELNPSPRQLDELIPILYKETVSEVDRIKSYINKPIELLKNLWKFFSCKKISKRYNGDYDIEDSRNVNFAIYALSICSVYPQNVDEKELFKINISIGLYISDITKLLKHLKMNGFLLNDPELIMHMFHNIVHKSSISSTPAENWLEVLDSFPIIKDSISSIIEKAIGVTRFYSSDLEIIKKYYPEWYDKANESSEMISQYQDFSRIKPYANYQNSETYVQTTLRQKKFTLNEWFNDIYIKYFGEGVLKKYKFVNSKEIAFIVLILFKLNRMNEFSEFTNIKWYSWGKNSLDYLVRMCFGIAQPFKSPELILNNDEGEKVLTSLMSIDYKGMDDVAKYFSFSLAYYEKSWGFSNYLKIIEKQRLRTYHYMDSTGTHSKEESEVRIRFMKHIISYLIKNNRLKDCKEVVDTVMSWKMDKVEKKKSLEFIVSSYELDVRGEEMRKWEEYIGKYYKIE